EKYQLTCRYYRPDILSSTTLPTDNYKIGKIGLPPLVNYAGFILELIFCLDKDMARLAHSPLLCFLFLQGLLSAGKVFQAWKIPAGYPAFIALLYGFGNLGVCGVAWRFRSLWCV